jgi:hypothetical protein
VYVCMYVCLYVFMYVCMYVFVCVCVCMYVCMYILNPLLLCHMLLTPAPYLNPLPLPLAVGKYVVVPTTTGVKLKAALAASRAEPEGPVVGLVR